VMTRMRQSSWCWNFTNFKEANPEDWPTLYA
jgi:hypothetical protein